MVADFYTVLGVPRTADQRSSGSTPGRPRRVEIVRKNVDLDLLGPIAGQRDACHEDVFSGLPETPRHGARRQWAERQGAVRVA